MKDKIPAIVSKRNQFTPADELVDQAMMRLPDEYKHPDFQKWLSRYTETVIKSIASNFATAAARGIEQAANLLCDPDFYATRKRQDSNAIKRARDEQAQQEWERKQQRSCPTLEQAEAQKRYCEREITYHQEQIAKQVKRLGELAAMIPVNVQAGVSKSTQ